MDRYLDEGLSADERVEFSAMLTTDAEARRAYWRLAAIHGAMRVLGQARIGSKNAAIVLNQHDGSAAAPKSPHGLWLKTGGRGIWAWFAALSVALVAAVAIWLAGHGNRENVAQLQSPQKEQAASKETVKEQAVKEQAAKEQVVRPAISPPGTARSVVAGEGGHHVPMVVVGARADSSAPHPSSLTPYPSTPVARLTRVVSGRWTNPQAALSPGAEIFVGQRLDLASGEAEIVFTSGAVIVLCQATILEVDSATKVRLLMGRVTARAETSAAHGFTVDTRTGSVTDLGTQFDVQSAADGHSQVVVTKGAVEIRSGKDNSAYRLEAGEVAQIEPGEAGVRAIIEGGTGTPEFKFRTIEPPSDADYADASQHHAKIRIVEGRLGPTSGPVERLIDGRGQSKADSPEESCFFWDNGEGKILLDLGKVAAVRKINTYSWHLYEKVPPGHDMRDVRATQRYTLYGYAGDMPPATAGNPATHGWTLISRVDTDEFFTVPPIRNRPPQQAVSITGNDGAVGRYRFLLWAVQPTHAEGPTDDPKIPSANQNTFFGEFDVYAE